MGENGGQRGPVCAWRTDIPSLIMWNSAHQKLTCDHGQAMILLSLPCGMHNGGIKTSKPKKSNQILKRHSFWDPGAKTTTLAEMIRFPLPLAGMHLSHPWSCRRGLPPTNRVRAHTPLGGQGRGTGDCHLPRTIISNSVYSTMSSKIHTRTQTNLVILFIIHCMSLPVVKSSPP